MGSANDVLALLPQFGFAAPLLVYLFWREKCDREDRKRREERQAVIDEKDADAREKLAASLATLSALIQARFNV